MALWPTRNNADAATAGTMAKRVTTSVLALSKQATCGKLTDMSNLVEDAVRVLRQLPEDMQKTAARAIIDYSAAYDE
jgi:hypothetical protein